MPEYKPLAPETVSTRRAPRRPTFVFVITFAAVCAWYFGRLAFFYPLDHHYPMVASPNYDRRPLGERIDCVVLHATAQNEMSEATTLFAHRGSGVSAHFVVGRDGRVVQMVPVERRAWHAGVSQLAGVDGVNDYSVGIEMVNRDDGRDPYTNAQYRAVAGIIRLLRTRLTIPDDRVVSHAQIALPPGRKLDPLGFDFARLRRMLR